jgi:alkylation response protein AidB-like acyl-CoA dehydrogenase
VFSACAHLFACAKPIELFADDPLKALVLPRLASGQWIGANAITEAEAGSDVFALRTTARRDGDGYVLNGAKSYVTNGPVADVFLVYASTDLEHGYLGVSAFVVERDTPGLQIGRALDKLGLSTSPVCSIYLEDCRVPGRNLVGREGIGGRIFEASMRWERGCLFASYLGLMQRQLDVSLRYARERRQGKRPIGGYQAISHRLVDMKLRLEAARMLLYRACWLADRDAAEAGQAIALAKLALSEAAVQSSLDAIQIHGAIGLARDAGVERALRDALPARIFSGTSEIQRNIAARNMGL